MKEMGVSRTQGEPGDALSTRDREHTMALTYQAICQGERPWIALGNFMNEWFDYAIDRRPTLGGLLCCLDRMALCSLRRTLSSLGLQPFLLLARTLVRLPRST